MASAVYDRVGRMPKRPVFLPKFAGLLVSLREARRWKQSQAADIAKRRGIKLGYQAFRWLEEGKIKNPEPELLRAVAQLYDLPYEDVAAMAMEERYALPSDLLRHSGDQRSGPHGGAVVPASARIVELERQVADYKARLGQVEDVARKLAAIAVADAESREVESPPASRRRVSRKTA